MLLDKVAALPGFMDNHEGITMEPASMLHVESHDNQGTDETPWGFVYFNDNKRVAYVASANAPGGPRVTASTGGWPPITPSHTRLAREYLILKGLLQAPPARNVKEVEHEHSDKGAAAEGQ